MIYVRRASGLLQPFDPPELTLEAAADRGWSQAEGGRLLEPAPPAYLPTYPLVAAAGWLRGYRQAIGGRELLLDSLEEAGW